MLLTDRLNKIKNPESKDSGFFFYKGVTSLPLIVYGLGITGGLIEVLCP